MSLRFSPTGPEFPAELIDALLAGDVVFLCGTGISAPQLPTFAHLVDRIFAALSVDKEPSEELAYGAGRYEEVLGSLARRLADPAQMLKEAANQLAVPDEPHLEQHRTILRLSRDLANRVLIVTTNFDTLLERTMAELEAGADISAESFAGQALPAPGSPSFSGIIHLHGRLEDESLSLEATPLVLTSADYGDAYMRSGWASRFLFDLARCKTIVLVGYSAGDAPVRYFLNVLEADRARFPDLKPVYALDSYVDDPGEAEKPWGTVAVTPIPYSKTNPETGETDHAPLWRDLASLAELAERPKPTRTERLRKILAEPASDLTDSLLAELRWLIAGRRDLWPVVIETIEDSGWFVVFEENNLWTREDAQWVIPTWIARGFEERARFQAAVEWQGRLGSRFTEHLAGRLRQGGDLKPVWAKVWRQLCYARPDTTDWFESQVYAIKQCLESGVVLEADLQRAIALLSPVFSLRKFYFGAFGDEVEEDTKRKEPERLADLARVQFGRRDHYGSREILAALAALDAQAPRILELATSALHSAVECAIDLDLIYEDVDTSDYSVPSVDEHPQNEHHDGVLFLVRAIATSFTQVSAHDPSAARRIALQWRGLAGRIGVRLTLFAMRSETVFEGSEAMHFLLEMGEVDFWGIRREIALLLADRAGDAKAGLVGAIEQRICETGDAYLARYDIDEGQSDWRPYARDNEVWLRLSMLAEAGVLSKAGAQELAAIKVRRPHLDRPVEDRDYFSSYVSSTRTVEGDVEPIARAAPDDRLSVVQEMLRSPDIEKQRGWRTYCRTDPQGAFETLSAAPLNAANLDLWNDFLATLSIGDESTKALRDNLAVASTATLGELEAEVLEPTVSSLVDLFLFGPRSRIADREAWYDRLWTALLLDSREIPPNVNLGEGALNDPAGRFARIVLLEHEAARKDGSGDLPRQRARLAAMGAAAERAGTYARANFVQELPFLTAADDTLVRDILKPRIAGEGEGKALRELLIRRAAITPELSRLMPDEILMAVSEAQPDHSSAVTIAAGILRPALAELRGDADPHWGITATDVRQLMRDASGAIRRGALVQLNRWAHLEEGGVVHAWNGMVRPFLDRLWPKERRFVDEANNEDMASLAVGAGALFPEALGVVRPFLTPYSGRPKSLRSVIQSSAPEDFPRETLDLLWCLFGRIGTTSYDSPTVLDRLLKADAAIEVDRRFQSLEQRTQRY